MPRPIGALCGGRLAKAKGVRYGPPNNIQANVLTLTPVPRPAPGDPGPCKCYTLRESRFHRGLETPPLSSAINDTDGPQSRGMELALMFSNANLP